jgi:hypothetical protein
VAVEHSDVNNDNPFLKAGRGNVAVTVAWGARMRMPAASPAFVHNERMHQAR